MTAIESSALRHISQIGSVIEVSGYRVSCELIEDPSAPEESTRFGTIQIGALVKLSTPSTTAYGFVDSIALDAKGQARAEIDLLGEAAGPAGSAAQVFARGITVYPVLGSAVFAASETDMTLIYAKPNTATLAVGSLHHFPKKVAYLKSEVFFSKHSAIVGTTGAGKSCALALILRALLGRHLYGHILLLDPHGEYAPAFPDMAENITPESLRLPYWLFGFDEIVEVLCSKEASARDREAIILKDAIIQAKRNFLEGTSDFELTVDTPTPYLISELINCISDDLGKLLKPDTAQPYLRLISTLEGLIRDTRYRFMFDRELVHEDMGAVIGRILRIPVDGRPITVLNISAVPSEITNVVVSLICRLVFDFAVQTSRGDAIPIMIGCDEAHRYIPRDGTPGFEPTRQSIGRIAKEGRKYGLSLCLVTQRPSELSETILTQCSTVIALRMPNMEDQRYVRSHLPDAYGGLLNMLPTLGEQEAILVGEGAIHPMRIRFNDLPPQHRPRVAPTNFPAAWDREEKGKEFLDAVIKRWRGW